MLVVWLFAYCILPVGYCSQYSSISESVHSPAENHSDGSVRFRRFFSSYPPTQKSKRAATARKERIWPDGVIPYIVAANFS
ncbi:unnamed protein product, partial [Strongylus vulgaris]